MHLLKHLVATVSQQLTEPRVMILTKYTVVCNMPFNVHRFYFPDFESKKYKNDYAVLQTLRNHKFHWGQVGLKLQPFFT